MLAYRQPDTITVEVAAARISFLTNKVFEGEFTNLLNLPAIVRTLLPIAVNRSSVPSTVQT